MSPFADASDPGGFTERFHRNALYRPAIDGLRCHPLPTSSTRAPKVTKRHYMPHTLSHAGIDLTFSRKNASIRPMRSNLKAELEVAVNSSRRFCTSLGKTFASSQKESKIFVGGMEVRRSKSSRRWTSRRNFTEYLSRKTGSRQSHLVPKAARKAIIRRCLLAIARGPI